MLHLARLTRIALVALALQLPGSPVRAQDRLLVSAGPAGSPLNEIGAIAQFGQPIAPRPSWAGGEPSGGGRYFVEQRGFAGGSGLPAQPAVVVETATGQAISVSGVILAVDPIRTRVFSFTGSALVAADLTLGTTTTLLPSVTAADLGTLQYAPNADELFIRPAGGDVRILDATSGAAKRLVTFFGGPTALTNFLTAPEWSSWRVSADGTRLFALTTDGSALRVFDTHANTEVARVRMPTSGNGVLMPDLHGDRFFVVQGGVNAWTIAVAGMSGALQGAVALNGYCAPVLRASPHTGRIYLMSFGGGGGGIYGPIVEYVSAFDGASLEPRGSVTVADNLDLCGGALALVTPPGAPRTPSVSVAGHDVTLGWTNVGNATDFVLDVGFAPGQTALTLPLGAATHQTIPNAPSGRYYARVRGGNLFGSSPASSEITIVVP